MRFLPLLWSGIWRKPVRTALIFLQVVVAFALFGVLQGMKTGMDRAVGNARADVLYVGAAVWAARRYPSHTPIGSGRCWSQGGVVRATVC